MHASSTTIKIVLARLRHRVQLCAALRGILAVLGVVVGGLLVALTIEMLVWMPPLGRLITSGVLLSGAVFALSMLVVYPVMQRRPDSMMAVQLEEAHPRFRGMLITAVNLYSSYKEKHPFSKDIAEEVLRTAAEHVTRSSLASVVSTRPIKRMALMSAPPLLVLLIMLGIFGEGMVQAGGRLLHPFTAYAKGPQINVLVHPGNITVVKGDSLRIKVAFSAQPHQNAHLFFKRNDRSVGEQQNFIASDSLVYTSVFKDIRKPFTYFVVAPGVPSVTYQVRVADRPMLRALRWILRPPRYTGIPVREITDNITQVESMRGSRITLAFTANKTLAGVTAVFDDSSRVHGSVEGVKGSLKFRALRNRRFRLYLTDTDSIRTTTPVTYTILVLHDDPPRIRIEVPGDDVEAPETMQLPLQISVWDDFGFSSVILSYRTDDHDWSTQSIPLHHKKGPEQVLSYTWSLEDAGLLPDETMSYFITVYDNDLISGYKSAISKTYHVRNPSIFEMFDDLEKEEETRIQELEEVVHRGAQMQEQLQKMQREMLNEKNMSWERKKEIEGVMKKHQKMAEKLQNAAQSLDASIEKMRNNDMAGSETMEKLSEIKKLMKEVASPEMREMMRKMNEAVNKVSQKDIQKALKNFSFSQEKYLEKLDRTLALLKKIQAERALDEAIRKADALQQQQEQINEELDAQRDEDTKDALANREQQAADDTKRMENDLDKLEKQLREVAPKAADALEKARNFMRESRVAETMKQMSESMQQGDQNQAAQQGQQAEQDLAETGDMLGNAKQQMMQAEKEKILKDIQIVIIDLLYLSATQEDLYDHSQGLSRRSTRMRTIAQTQRLVLDGMTQVAARILVLARKSVFIPTEVGAEIGNAVTLMRGTIKKLENRNSRAAVVQQKKAVFALDQAVVELQRVEDMLQQMASMSQGAMMEQLKQMGEKQGGLNQATQSLMEMMMGAKEGASGMSMQQRSQMGRMAAEQQALQEQLSAMASQTGSMPNMLGKLGKMGKEMADIAAELKSGHLTEKTLKRQQRVLDQLLDTQRSVRRQDFSKERKAAEGIDTRRLSPQELDAASVQKDDPWQDTMLKALQKKYPRDYQNLIRAYFKRLSQERKESE